jgi:hypothetical protein
MSTTHARIGQMVLLQVFRVCIEARSGTPFAVARSALGRRFGAIVAESVRTHLERAMAVGIPQYDRGAEATMVAVLLDVCRDVLRTAAAIEAPPPSTQPSA